MSLVLSPGPSPRPAHSGTALAGGRPAHDRTAVFVLAVDRRDGPPSAIDGSDPSGYGVVARSPVRQV